MSLFIYHGRLRAGWRLLLHTIMTLIFTILLGIPFLLLLGGKENLAIEPSVQSFPNIESRWFLISQLCLAIGITLATYLARRWLDKKSFRSLGVEVDHRTLTDLLAGFMIAGFMMGVIFLVELAFGWLHIEGFAWQADSSARLWQDIFLVTLLFILVGWTEELLSRGYHLQNLVEGLNLPVGVILSSLIFAILHQDNPSFSLGAFLGLFFAGLFFCFAYYRIGNLWVPIGLHIGWNIFEGVVFGFQVSGLVNLPKLIRQSVAGPDWVTGGAFGPEAGLILAGGLLVGIGLLHIYQRLRNNKVG